MAGRRVFSKWVKFFQHNDPPLPQCSAQLALFASDKIQLVRPCIMQCFPHKVDAQRYGYSLTFPEKKNPVQCLHAHLMLPCAQGVRLTSKFRRQNVLLLIARTKKLAFETIGPNLPLKNVPACFKPVCCQPVFVTNFDDFETGSPVVQVIKGLMCRASYAKKNSLFKKKNVFRSNRGSSEMESADGTTLIMGYHHIWFRSSEKAPLVRTLEDGLEFHVAAGVRP